MPLICCKTTVRQLWESKFHHILSLALGKGFEPETTFQTEAVSIDLPINPAGLAASGQSWPTIAGAN